MTAGVTIMWAVFTTWPLRTCQSRLTTVWTTRSLHWYRCVLTTHTSTYIHTQIQLYSQPAVTMMTILLYTCLLAAVHAKIHKRRLKTAEVPLWQGARHNWQTWRNDGNCRLRCDMKRNVQLRLVLFSTESLSKLCVK